MEKGPGRCGCLGRAAVSGKPQGLTAGSPDGNLTWERAGAGSPQQLRRNAGRQMGWESAP